VHYSTDYVFFGDKSSPYTEDDVPNPLNVYGRTKLAGDEAIYESGCRYLILRTAWLFGIRGHNFIEAILKLEMSNRFLRSFAEFQAPVARAGMYNSLAQTLLKITAPGVPDFYQGAELWDFNLVDPDNRRPIDFAKRRASLASLPADDDGDLTGLVSQLVSSPQDGRIKLYLTSRALRFRRRRQALFAEGDYLPLTARGQKADHVIAFARASANQTAVVVTGRFFTRLGDPNQPPTGGGVWGDTAVALNYESEAGWYREVFTGQRIRAERASGGVELPLAQVFAHLPVALLECEPDRSAG